MHFSAYSKTEMECNWCIAFFPNIVLSGEFSLKYLQKTFWTCKTILVFPGITAFSSEEQAYFTLEDFLRGHRIYRNPVFFCRSFFSAIKVKAVFQSASSTFSCLSSQFLIARLIPSRLEKNILRGKPAVVFCVTPRLS